MRATLEGIQETLPTRPVPAEVNDELDRELERFEHWLLERQFVDFGGEVQTLINAERAIVKTYIYYLLLQQQDVDTKHPHMTGEDMRPTSPETPSAKRGAS